MLAVAVPVSKAVAGAVAVSSSVAALGSHRLTLENVPLREGNPVTWGDSVVEWERYLAEKAGQYLVFVGDDHENRGEIAAAPYSHRFRQEYTEMQYAKIQEFVRGSLREYDDPHLVFLTFSSSTTDAMGDPRPSLDHLDELTDAWSDGVYYELNRVLDGDRKRDPWEPRPEWEYLYILEPTTNEGMVPGGYGHAHAGIVVDGAVEPERFESVIDRHLEECPGAEGRAHEFDRTIEVKPAAELGNPGAYLFKYLGKSWDVDEMEDYERRFAALLKESERQRFRASNGAQRWMQRDEEESETGEWLFAGIGDREAVDELRQYEDVEDFLIATDATGVRSWLQGREDEVEIPEVSPEEFWSHESAEGSRDTARDELRSRFRTADRTATAVDGDRPPPSGT